MVVMSNAGSCFRKYRAQVDEIGNGWPALLVRVKSVPFRP
jgi:hypothetical protein